MFVLCPLEGVIYHCRQAPLKLAGFFLTCGVSNTLFLMLLILFEADFIWNDLRVYTINVFAQFDSQYKNIFCDNQPI